MTPPTFLYYPLCSADPAAANGCTVDWHTQDAGRCRKPGKCPVGRWGDITGWKRERPEGNVAVRTGPETGLLVIDVDSPAAQAQYDSWGLPPTFTVRSGRPEGGHHYYFRWPDGLVAVPPMLDGIEVKGAGRYVVGWDSTHISGLRYEREGGSLATLPEPFVGRLRTGAPQQERLARGLEPGTPEAEERLAEWVALFPGAEEREDGNWWMCCPAHVSASKSSLSAVASGERVLLKCWAGCLTETIVEAMDWSLYDLRARAAAVYDPERQVDLSDRTPRAPAETGLPTQVSLTELLGLTLPPIQWAVPGMIPEGLTLLAGPPKLGKSWFVLDLAIQAAAGRPFLGHSLVAGDVLYLALEDNLRRLKGRARAVLGTDTPPERLELWTRAGKLGADLLPDLETWLDSRPLPKLVIIDTLGRVQEHSAWAGDSKDGGYAEAVDALAGLQDMASARGVAVVIITHTKKGGWHKDADPLEAVLGSQGYAGTADSILVMGRGRGDSDGKLFVTGREIPEESITSITFDAARCRWVEGKADVTLEQEILNLMDDEPYKLTKNQIAKAVERNKAEVLATIDLLVDQGALIHVPSKRRGGGEVYGPPPVPGAK